VGGEQKKNSTKVMDGIDGMDKAQPTSAVDFTSANFRTTNSTVRVAVSWQHRGLELLHWSSGNVGGLMADTTPTIIILSPGRLSSRCLLLR